MSLKVVAALIFAAMVAHSTAFFMKGQGKEYNDLPRITFTKNNDAMRIRSTASKLSFFDRFENQTAWTFTAGNGTTIVQEMRFPFLWGTYEVSAKANDVNANGFVPVMFTKMNFTFAITASGNKDACHLNYKITPPQKDDGMLVYFTGLEETAKAFEEPTIFKEFSAYVWEVLSKVLPYRLKNLVPPYLATRVDMDELCTDLLKANATHYPEPDFCDDLWN